MFCFGFSLAFTLIPRPAEYGAEEFSLDAVPMLGLVRIGFGRGGCESTETCSSTIQINPVVHANWCITLVRCICVSGGGD